MTLSDAILATLAYHDIFNYPLTEKEAHSYLIVKSSYSNYNKNLQLLIKQKKVFQKEGLIFLQGRGATVKIRQTRKKASGKKLKRAMFYSKILQAIPTIKFVAISGALSMENADQNDDIDLVIVSHNHSLWTTRLLANILLQPYRRKAGESHTKDKACLNMFLEESNLKIRTQNLYTAHELAQLKPIWQRGKTYQNLIKINSWLKNYLPNWQPYPTDSYKTYPQSNFWSIVTSQMSIVEDVTRVFQLRYMRRRITSEKIGDSQLFFHPGNTQEWVLAEYNSRIKNLNLRNKLTNCL
jgi:hypothetical protein